ncbi:hypothetical protein BDF19DRAFT_426090 [Syncephalis fuscata]|nr:hypothetical protein BDF19DRAFT_426090 [Syncephalis fuscata]
MFMMKSILAIAATAFMLASVTQATPANNILGALKSESIEFMGFKNNDPESPFTMHSIQFTETPYKNNDVHYIKGKQHGNLITLACLNAIEKAGWYAQMDFNDICIIKTSNGGYIPRFFNFNNAISTKREFNNEEMNIVRFSVNEATLETFLQLAPTDVKIEVLCKLKDAEYKEKREVLYSSHWVYFTLHYLEPADCLKKADKAIMYSLERMQLINTLNWPSRQQSIK